MTKLFLVLSAIAICATPTAAAPVLIKCSGTFVEKSKSADNLSLNYERSRPEVNFFAIDDAAKKVFRSGEQNPADLKELCQDNSCTLAVTPSEVTYSWKDDTVDPKNSSIRSYSWGLGKIDRMTGNVEENSSGTIYRDNVASLEDSEMHQFTCVKIDQLPPAKPKF